MFSNLREFLDAVAAIGELRVLEGAHWDLEIGALTEYVAEQPDRPCLLFDRIPGYPAGHRVATLFLASPNRMALAFDLPRDLDRLEYVRLWQARATTRQSVPPRFVSTGPVLARSLEGTHVDVTRFPAPRWGPLDGGRYIGTGDTVVIQDPDSDWVNCGAYRMMIHDERTLSVTMGTIHHGWVLAERWWRQGRACPVAICLGLEPGLWLATTQNVPEGVSEWAYAGALLGRPVDLLRAPLTGLPVPAEAEIVLEGEIPPPAEDSRPEGPHAEWTGYFGVGEGDGVAPVVRIKAIHHRPDPILLGWRNVRPYMDNEGWPRTAGAVWAHLEREGVAGVRGVWDFLTGMIVVIGLAVTENDQPRRALRAAMQARSVGNLYRHFVVVDDDVDITNLQEVLWAITTRADPARDIEIVDGVPTSPIDPLLPPERRAARDYRTSVTLIDACRPVAWRASFPAANRPDPALRDRLLRRWLPILQAGAASQGAGTPRDHDAEESRP